MVTAFSEHQRHDEIVRADVVQRADIRMVQRGDAVASRSKRSLKCSLETLIATEGPMELGRDLAWIVMVEVTEGEAIAEQDNSRIAACPTKSPMR